MKTPDEIIDSLITVIHAGPDYYNGYHDGFNECEERYNNLWKEYLESLNESVQITISGSEKSHARHYFINFVIWIEERNNRGN